MSYEKENHMKDTSCRWIECDSSCHLNTCALKIEIARLLEERFQNLCLKFSYLTYLQSDGCDKSEDCWYEERVVGKPIVDDNDIKKYEKEISDKAEQIVNAMTDDDVIELYKKLKTKAVNIELAKISEHTQKIEQYNKETLS